LESLKTDTDLIVILKERTMSEITNTIQKKKEHLKELILKLHNGTHPEEVRHQIKKILGQVPYKMVVDVEQELINEGLDVKEVLGLCDIHAEVLKGNIDHSGENIAPPGHPVHTFKEENNALLKEIQKIQNIFIQIQDQKDNFEQNIEHLQIHFNNLGDIEKHYQRKENLLFPFLEKNNITGPPKVMWGKHDEVRELLKKSITALKDLRSSTNEESTSKNRSKSEKFELVLGADLSPALNAIQEMIFKEEKILFPMSMDTLDNKNWYSVYKQSAEIGFCLIDPQDKWKPENLEYDNNEPIQNNKINLSTGKLTVPEIGAIFNTIPFDVTFVDSDDTVRYFSQGDDRIFPRNNAILGRKVQLCHPPKSVHIVEQILNDFKSGSHKKASFWITLNDRFIVIEYFALRDNEGKYLGCLEVTQDLTEKKKLEGQKRLLSYEN
jgi:DUF438 domain-containing protein